MKEGAVPSNAYDILKLARERNINGIEVKGNIVNVSREAETDYFSESDIECLDKTINKFNNLSGKALYDAAHDKAWKENWIRREDRRSVPIPINDIAYELRDSENLIEYISNCC